MNLRKLIPLSLALSLGFHLVSALHAQSEGEAGVAARFAGQPLPDGKPHTFRVAHGQFQLDGKPFQVISGEMHYPRIPREYWRARLKMARAMGLNAITTYVFWNEHEAQKGVYDFSGNNDVAEFIREAQQEGLYVILRPGPYVCAEWEFGGYPAWLLKDPTTQIRSADPKYMEPARRWIMRLGKELAPLQVGNGGPVLLVQVENEYGSFGSDHAYMEQNKQALLDAGFTKAQLYTADGPDVIAKGSLPELPVGINFDGNHVDSAEKSFATLKAARPEGPMFNSEFWAGWFDHWGGPHAATSTQTQVANLKWELEHGYSVSIYMFHGGTDFGWMNGANSSDAKKEYEPDVTSYDYDSALDESGRPTEKYFAFRDVIAKATGLTPPAVPKITMPIAVAAFALGESASLWENLPKPILSDKPLAMEDIGQNYGWILYRTRFDGAGDTGAMTIHDFAHVYLNEQLEPMFTLDRRLRPQDPNEGISNSAGGPPVAVDVLVENEGRINYSHQLLNERKGVVAVRPSAQPSPALRWKIYSLPMNDLSAIQFGKGDCSGPCFYRGTFNVAKPGDTFLDTSRLGKGQAWVNGHMLGRFWKIGPQRTLYIPGPWLKVGPNQLVIFDVDGKPGSTVEGLSKPMLGN